ncbi:MAG: group III truncated hemoglobin [Cyclobacteriaceae bacterium]
MSKSDILTRKDVELLIDSFYKRVVKDDMIGFFFNDVIRLDWQKHIPVMYDFWESVLFQKPTYRGNPLQKHLHLHQLHALKKEHFDQWLLLFSKTLDDLFCGEKTELAKTRALSIATVIQIKIAEISS